MTAILVLSGCGELPQSSPSTTSVGPVATPSTPPAASSPPTRAVVGRIKPLDCPIIVQSEIDYALPEGETGVSDIVTETGRMDGVERAPNDLIVVDGDRTAIVRDGRTVYIMHWLPVDAGGWLLSGTETCEAFVPVDSGTEP